MPEQKIREMLETLRAEIEALDAAEGPDKERLGALVAAIEERLGEHQPDGEDGDALLDGLRDAIAHFEVSNPRATGILNDIMVTLSNMGI